MRYKCKNCNKEIKINKEVLLFIDNKLVNKNAYCCNKQMDSMDKNEGIPTIIRNEYTKEDRIIQHKANQKERRLKKDGYDKNNPYDKPPKRRIK